MSAKPILAGRSYLVSLNGNLQIVLAKNPIDALWIVLGNAL
ncbi:hypothetical protein [Polynucleobacter sp. Fuers-14]|jgi:hypothetical protein|nr:hypothetical protein [Polynucleobacter sp. Fuers-14]